MNQPKTAPEEASSGLYIGNTPHNIGRLDRNTHRLLLVPNLNLVVCMGSCFLPLSIKIVAQHQEGEEFLVFRQPTFAR